MHTNKITNIICCSCVVVHFPLFLLFSLVSFLMVPLDDTKVKRFLVQNSTFTCSAQLVFIQITILPWSEHGVALTNRPTAKGTDKSYLSGLWHSSSLQSIALPLWAALKTVPNCNSAVCYCMPVLCCCYVVLVFMLTVCVWCSCLIT